MAKRNHPSEVIESMPEADLGPFLLASIDEDYFGEWVRWLATLFGIDIGDERVAAMFRTLSAHKFTNAELGLAGDWIEANNERFPVPAHFIACPVLGRNSAKG